MDPLSDVIASLDGRHSLFSRLETGGDWAIDFEGYRHAKFGAVLRGSCWVTAEGAGEPVRLAEHDCFLVGIGRSYRLASSPDVPAVPAAEVYGQPGGPPTRWGTGSETVLVGGRINLEEMDTDALSGILPPLVHVSATSDAADTLHALLPVLERETTVHRFGSALVIERLAHVAFVELLRAHAARDRDVWGPIPAALSDPQIGAALGLMHAEPGRRWTVDDLASAVHMSRSGFAGRFTELVGSPPHDYLLSWRMRIAAKKLRATDTSVAAIAAELGYQSESAFSNAFKRVTGRSPRHYRQALSV
ncbi:AraC family transcriptional regulator [Microbispora sp. RL4-1S]|uniref:AraC family transcriptional regulator n=1 Tax=Microbispora oryzae TaxID=2806554 RepID=A0A940WJJ4_9ACTN|nr:AraC family transcriptional regulator [Microbispora oryzae]MBP2702336.1 AraC family transcriptional regulator [Microbispora oryzae]